MPSKSRMGDSGFVSHPVRYSVFAGVFLYAWFYSHGIPLWDDDFTSWSWKIREHGMFRYLWEWIWPISTQPQYWGFNERPAQAFLYKVFELISGYESWSYYLYKSLSYAAASLAVFSWVMEITKDRRASAAAAVFFAAAPNVMAAHMWHPDFAPTAEALFGFLTLWIWRSVEETPASWRGLKSVIAPENRAWARKWLLISFAVYLSYKTKGDLKAIPLVLGGYLLLFRRGQLLMFAPFIALMALLAVPWGPGILSKLPPWFPGSQGSEIGWMYQPASLGSVWDFIVADGSWWSGLIPDLSTTPLALSRIIGPLLLAVLGGFLLKRELASEEPARWLPVRTREGRAVVFLLVWLGSTFAVLSALPELGHFYRVRYGIIPLMPVSILLGAVIHRFLAEHGEYMSGKGFLAGLRAMFSAAGWRSNAGRSLRFAFFSVAVFAFAAQTGVNLVRSAYYRKDIGLVAKGVDQAYGYVAANHPNRTLVLMPDFRPYDYRPDAPEQFRNKTWLKSADEIARFQPGETIVVSWKANLSDQYEVLHAASGCSSWSLFDLLAGCGEHPTSVVMRYLGPSQLLGNAAAAASEGRLQDARALYEEHLQQHPGNLGALFSYGLVLYRLSDFAAMREVYSKVEWHLPEHDGVAYNHALALEGIGQFGEAITRYERIHAKDPKNYAVLYHLFESARKSGRDGLARDTIRKMRDAYPQDEAVRKLATEWI